MKSLLKSKFKGLIFLYMIASLLSCNFSRTYKNRPKDIQEAEKVVEDFNVSLKERRYNDALVYFSNGKGSIDLGERNDKLNRIFILSSKELGDLKSSKLLGYNTVVVEGTKASGEYSMNYLATYEKYIVHQFFKLALEHDSIKIVDYKNELVSKISN